VVKLATLLRREPAQLEHLQLLPPEDLRMLREQVTDMLFTAHDATLQRLALASKLLPVGLVAMIGQHAFGAMLSARITALLDPGRAVEVAQKLPPSFLADIASELDPRRASDVIAGMPVDQIVKVTRELTRRGEYVTMGRFVGQLGDRALLAAVETIDDATLLRTAFVLEERDRLDALAELIGEERLEALIDAAEREGLWPEVLDLLTRLDAERLAEGLSRMSPERQELIAERARAAGLLGWPEVAS
jgi:Mg/Co/Ni transporter MgtE